MNILTFNGVEFQPVKQQNQIWLTSNELARALGYAETDSVTKLYNRHIDEFKPSMTQVIDISETVKLTAPKNQQNLVKKVRIFNLRGCHLIAMFARHQAKQV
ncbi:MULTISPECIES: BRO family protein [unclassified Moraxella]|uniref:BRO family protein n=1 Tax=unclassified Moraxella TaxID=2685852 RepID=UPI00359EBD83